MAKIEEIAKKIRNLGIIIGIPVLITISVFFYNENSKLYEKQIDAINAEKEVLKATNELLKQTQCPSALKLLKDQKELHQINLKNLENKLRSISTDSDKIEIAESIGKAVEELNKTRLSLDKLISPRMEDKFIALRHLAIDIPIKILEKYSRLSISLEESGTFLSIYDANLGDVCNNANYVEKFAFRNRKYNASLCAAGYHFIYHRFKVDKKKFTNSKTLMHLDIEIFEPFEIANCGYFEIVSPVLKENSELIYKDQNDPNNYYLYTCPFFINVNKSYHRRYLLCNVSKEENFKLRYQQAY